MKLAHDRRPGLPRTIAVLLAATLLPFLVSSSPAVHGLEPIHRRQERRDAEHVILADCRDKSNSYSSQMAYYRYGPDAQAQPDDVAVVATPDGQTALWVSTSTTALFTTTGTRFTSVLGAKGQEGDFAGTGDNGYTNFTCWQRYRAALYTWGEVSCAQVYDCDHSPAPARVETPTNSGNSGDSGSNSGGGISQGALIGIVVGAVVSLLVMIAIALWVWLWRRSRGRKRAAAVAELPAGAELSPDPFLHADEFKPPPSSAITTTPSGTWGTMSTAGTIVPAGPIYEMDGNWYRSEMATDTGKVELGDDRRPELASEQHYMGTPKLSAPVESPVVYDENMLGHQHHMEKQAQGR